MKKCFKCKNVKILGEFYNHPEMADSHLGKCKLCTKKDAAERYADPVARKKIIEYERQREKTPERKALKLEYQRRRRARSPGKNKARQKVMIALRNGQLKKGICEKCGSAKVEAHHEDYRQYLKVMWLCRKHHMEVENKIPF